VPVTAPNLFYNGLMAGLNLLYLLGTLEASKWQNNEIRYSIRSMAATNDIGWIGITGPEVPAFLSSIYHVKVQLRENRKWLNQQAQLLHAMNDPDVPEDLILMNDDFFMRDTPKWDWTPTHMGPCKAKWHNAWSKSVCMTGDVLRGLYYLTDPLVYEGHTPMPIKKSLALETLRTMIPLNSDKSPLQFRTFYGNQHGIGGNLHTNAKHKALNKWPADSPFLSLVSDPKQELKDYIVNAWPTPSRWEV
jgi:hypothetical protein